MIRLRDMIESDIEDYIRWWMQDNEWAAWNTPWVTAASTTAEEQRARWTHVLNQCRAAAPDAARWHLEIDQDGQHVGWVSGYVDMEYYPNPDKLPAIGVCVVQVSERTKGVGTESLRLYIEHLRQKAYPAVFIQTWSGNLPMLRVAEKLGFREVCRKSELREVRGRKYDAVTLRLDL